MDVTQLDYAPHGEQYFVCGNCAHTCLGRSETERCEACSSIMLHPWNTLEAAEEFSATILERITNRTNQNKGA